MERVLIICTFHETYLVTPAYFKFSDNSPSDIYPVYISNHGLPWTGFLVRQDLGDSR